MSMVKVFLSQWARNQGDLMKSWVQVKSTNCWEAIRKWSLEMKGSLWEGFCRRHEGYAQQCCLLTVTWWETLSWVAHHTCQIAGALSILWATHVPYMPCKYQGKALQWSGHWSCTFLIRASLYVTNVIYFNDVNLLLAWGGTSCYCTLIQQSC